MKAVCARRAGALLRCAAVSALMLGLVPFAAQAEVKVSGTSATVRVEASDASVDEILSALKDKFAVDYQSTARLERRVTGSYAGPLERVLARVLEGNDFFLKRVNNRVEVTLLARQPGGSVTAGAAAPAAKAAPAEVTAAVPPSRPIAAEQDKAAQPESASPEVTKDPAMTAFGPIVVAEGPAPTPLPGDSGPKPEISKSSVAPPMPVASSSSSDGPALAPSTAAPPAPPPGAAKSEDGPPLPKK